jgi:hypothetical protein
MNPLKQIITVLLLFMLLSCSKEYSNEGGGGLGLTCRLSNITSIDEQSGQGVYALNTKYDNNGRPNYVELYDSVLLNADFVFELEYRTSDTIITNTGDKLVLDGSKRLKKLLYPRDPGDPNTEYFVYEYKYNGSGYLIEKTLSVPSIPINIFQTNYTWAGGNLTRIESSSSFTGTLQRLIKVDLEYDMTKSPKNFIPLYLDALESFQYITAVEMGKPSVNLLARMTAVFYDHGGNPLPTEVTEITEAKFSNDGYLTEWYVSGGSFDAFGLFTGRNTFTYKCN